MTMSADVKCFVVGSARSGTTLLSVLLDRHSRLAMTPETVFYAEVAPLIDPSDPAGVEGVLTAWRRLPELELQPADVIERCDGDLRPHRVLRALLQLFAEARGKSWCGEKSPMHRKFVRAMLRDFPQAKVLHVLRDGRDVAASLLSAPWWTGDAAQAAAFWLDAVLDLERLEAAFPEQFLVVSYQALVSRPSATLGQVMTFLGLDFEPAQLDPALPSGVVLARSLQWKGRALQAIDAERVGRWRGLPATDQALLCDVLSPRLAELAGSIGPVAP